MPFKTLDLADLPAPVTAGKVSTEPMISIHDNGQIGFNSFIAKTLNKTVAMGIQVDENKIQFVPLNDVQAKQVLEKKKVAIPLKKAKKSNQAYIVGSALLKHLKYDYKAAGNQRYSVSMDAKGQIVLALPDVAPVAGPRKTRKPRVAKVAGTTNGGEQQTVTTEDVGVLTMAHPQPQAANPLSVEDLLS